MELRKSVWGTFACTPSRSRAAFAVLSALSLPDIPTWLGTQQKTISLPLEAAPVTGSVHELRALAYAARVMNVPLVQTPQEQRQQR